MPITKEALNNVAYLQIRPERLNHLETMIHKFIEDDISSAMLIKVLRNGVPIFEEIQGSCKDQEGQLTFDTIFPIFSITKPVIAVLILLLQEDGIIDVCDPIHKYLDGYDKNGWEEICVWHFITHTSGIIDEDFYTSLYRIATEKYNLCTPPENPTPAEWNEFNINLAEKMGIDSNQPHFRWLIEKELADQISPSHKPRSQMSYCNFGYQKLAQMIETVTGETIDEFATRRLFVPLEMVNSHWALPKEKWSKVIVRNPKCVSYDLFNSDKKKLDDSGAGGLKTTVNDILHFLEMIRCGGMYGNQRILSKASIREFVSNHNEDMNDVYDSWGLGIIFRSMKKDDSGILRSPLALNHGGYGGTNVLTDRETGISVALFTVENQDKGVVFGKLYNMIYSALD